jgi:hypothetical protein
VRRMGIIDHVSRFNKIHGYQEGWVFCSRFSHSLDRVAGLTTHPLCWQGLISFFLKGGVPPHGRCCLCIIKWGWWVKKWG